MPTVQELLKQRLEKHRALQTQNSDAAVPRISSNGEAPQGTGVPVSGSGDGGLVPANDSQPIGNASGQGRSDSTNSEARVNALDVAASVEPEQSVRTDLQPTALAIVERPDSDRLDGGSELLDGRDSESSSDLDASNPVHAGFLQRLHDLETSLLQRDPMMRTHLAAIHKTMIEHEEITNLLTVPEIAKIMAAQQVHTNIILVRDVAKASKTAANKRAAQIQLDDI